MEGRGTLVNKDLVQQITITSCSVLYPYYSVRDFKTMYPITYSLPLNRAKLSKNFLKTQSSNVSLIKIAFFFFKLSQFRLITTNTSTLAFHLIYLNSSASITSFVQFVNCTFSCKCALPASLHQHVTSCKSTMCQIFHGMVHFFFFVFQANSESRVSLGFLLSFFSKLSVQIHEMT